MALPTIFATLTVATGTELDGNFNALGALVTIPCTAAGTNAIVLTPLANTPTVGAYGNYGRYSGIVSATNTGAVTVRVGALAILNGYKDTGSGPVALAAGDLHIGNSAVFVYDVALNSGAGGFHIMSGLI